MPDKQSNAEKPRRVVTRKRASIGADVAAPVETAAGGDTLTVQTTAADDPPALDQSDARTDPIDHEALGEMIAKAAYYRAERRGFEPGYEIEDWIAAEAEVSARMREVEKAQRMKPTAG